MKPFSLLLMILMSSVLGLLADDDIERAEKIFKEYTTLAAKFDPAVADLYSERAKVKNTRTYPTGNKREVIMEAKQYKALLRMAMPLAKKRGDTSSYSKVQYTKEGKNVKITALRFSNLKKYSSPVLLVVGPDADGTWRILQEETHSEP